MKPAQKIIIACTGIVIVILLAIPFVLLTTRISFKKAPSQMPIRISPTVTQPPVKAFTDRKPLPNIVGIVKEVGVDSFTIEAGSQMHTFSFAKAPSIKKPTVGQKVSVSYEASTSAVLAIVTFP